MLERLNRKNFDEIYRIMEQSFPLDERRPYEEQKVLLENPEYEIYVYKEFEKEEVKGFLAVWELEEYVFIEHFAVDNNFRNRGIGGQMLSELKARIGKRFCLEVEPPQEELTKRRVAFYKRNGFYLNHYDYIQPALSKGQNEVPLFIMTTEDTVMETEFQKIKSLLYEKVYHVNDGKREYKGCTLCPRECGADRKRGKTGYCGVAGEGVLGARAALHMWEEPCISGLEGSGTVFFSGCPLRCVYCQNYDIAHAERGTEVTIERLSDIFLELQEKGANNINLVTPTHYTPEIIAALNLAREKGLKLPIVYNCSGYEKVETLRCLKGLVDIYLTDFKYMDKHLAKRYSRAEDYPDIAKKAIAEMVEQCGNGEFDARGMMRKGVIVRHLLLPGQVQNGKDVVKYLYETYGDTVFLSIMNQYTPLSHMKDYPEINRKVTEEEYEELIDYAIELGVENGFIQEGETAEESFIPAFDNEGWQK